MIAGEGFWDAYDKFDFNALESAIRSATLADAAYAENRSFCWTLTAAGNFLAEAAAVTYTIAERSPKACGALALSSLALGLTCFKARYWNKEADSIPHI